MNSIIVLVLSLCVLSVNSLALCPTPYIDISPCKCIDSNETDGRLSVIQCTGDEALDLSAIFDILNANIGPKNRDFNTFYLNNSNIEEIPENVFKDFTFDEIIIEKTPKLSKISSNAFRGLEKSVKHLHLKDTKLNLNSDNYSDIQAFDDLKRLQLLDFSTSECPPSNLLGAKCKCDVVVPTSDEIQGIVRPKSVAILCSQVANNEELFQLFDGLNTHLTGNERNFFRFQLKESKIDKLPESLFKSITFSEIVIQDCIQLSHINRDVFKTVEPFVNHLSIIDIDLKNSSEDLWYAISSLPNLVSVNLVNVLDDIPDRAFKKVGPQPQWRLRLFSHSGFESSVTPGHRIKNVGRYAFNNLPNLRTIKLEKNVIESIDKYAFANQVSSDRQLVIRLAKNKLNQSSFAVGSLAGSQRPIKLELGHMFVGCNRDIVYLEESVFSAFLDKAGNMLDIGCSFAMQCDCHMRWLFEGPDFWKTKITSAYGDVVIPCEVDTDDGTEEVSIWDVPENYFECNSQISYTEPDYESALNNSVENEVQELIGDAFELIV